MTKESNPVDIFCSMAWKTYSCFYLLVWFSAARSAALKVSKSRKQIMMSLILQKRSEAYSRYYYTISFIFWKNPGLYNLLSRFTDL